MTSDRRNLTKPGVQIGNYKLKTGEQFRSLR